MQTLRHLEQTFPKLSAAGYDPTSAATGSYPVPRAYNCISWAASDPRNCLWWWPSAYWPPWVRHPEATVACFIKTFRWLGYGVCSDSRREFAYEKVALYGIHNSLQFVGLPKADELHNWKPTHMARQLPDGTWSSKIGGYEDITHFTLDALETYGHPRSYGCAVIFMKRLMPMSWVVRFLQWSLWKLSLCKTE